MKEDELRKEVKRMADDLKKETGYDVAGVACGANVPATVVEIAKATVSKTQCHKEPDAP